MGIFRSMRYRIRAWRHIRPEDLREITYRNRMNQRAMRRLEKKGKIKLVGGPLPGDKEEHDGRDNSD